MGLEVLVESQRIQPERGIIGGPPVLRRIRRHGLGLALLITGEQIAAQILFGLPSAGRVETFLCGAIGTGIAPSRFRSLHALCLTIQGCAVREAVVQETGVVKARTPVPNFSIGTLVVAGVIPSLARNAQLDGWS